MDYLHLPSGRLAYICRGQGPAVLLLHGLGSSSLDWQPQIEHLARHFRVYALDLRGHGQSAPLRAPVTRARQTRRSDSRAACAGRCQCLIVCLMTSPPSISRQV